MKHSYADAIFSNRDSIVCMYRYDRRETENNLTGMLFSQWIVILQRLTYIHAPFRADKVYIFSILVAKNQFKLHKHKMSDYSSTPTNSGDSELQEFLMAEKQKAQVQAQVSIQTTPISNFVSCRSSLACDNQNTIDIPHFSCCFCFSFFRFTNSTKSVGIDALTHRAVNLTAKPKHA